MSTVIDEAHVREWMVLALAEAGAAAARGEVPVGAVIVHEGEILARAGNRIEETRDAAAHAEMLVLQEAARRLGRRRLTGCRLVVTLEPCPMCAMAMILARIDALHFGARDPKFGGVASVIELLAEGRFNHTVPWTEGTLADASAALLKKFFQARRS